MSPALRTDRDQALYADLTAALDRADKLESAIREATEMGWCYESRELLWGAVNSEPERTARALEESAGYVAEAQAVLDHHESLEAVLVLADRLYWEAHPTLRKAGNWKRLGKALAAAAATRDEYAPEKLQTRVLS